MKSMYEICHELGGYFDDYSNICRVPRTKQVATVLKKLASLLPELLKAKGPAIAARRCNVYCKVCKPLRCGAYRYAEFVYVDVTDEGDVHITFGFEVRDVAASYQDEKKLKERLSEILKDVLKELKARLDVFVDPYGHTNVYIFTDSPTSSGLLRLAQIAPTLRDLTKSLLRLP